MQPFARLGLSLLLCAAATTHAGRVVDRYRAVWATPVAPDVPHGVPVGRPAVPAGPFVGNGDVAVLYSAGNRSAAAGTSDDAQPRPGSAGGCNTTAWDAVCPPMPADWQKCEACCQAHKALMFRMGCIGPTPHWNYTWQDHCEGKPPPPWRPGPPPPGPPPPAAAAALDWQQWLYLSKNDMWGSDKFLQSDGIHLSAGRVGILVRPPASESSAVHGRVEMRLGDASVIHALANPS
eukprot:SAG22_NODE_5218_length_1059_cov_1.196875_1_plen_234_part_01